MDEFGNDDVGAPNPTGSPAWNTGFITYLVNWSKTQGGSGALAFVDAWVDGNSMINGDGSFNAWGTQFTTQYVMGF